MKLMSIIYLTKDYEAFRAYFRAAAIFQLNAANAAIFPVKRRYFSG